MDTLYLHKKQVDSKRENTDESNMFKENIVQVQLESGYFYSYHVVGMRPNFIEILQQNAEMMGWCSTAVHPSHRFAEIQS